MRIVQCDDTFLAVRLNPLTPSQSPPFAALDNAVADARIAAFDSKYEQKFWRPITALNADTNGAVTNNYATWHPLAATPAHPANTAGHSATGAVVTFSQAQLENGASLLYLGVHFGFDNLQGQLLGLAVADTIIKNKKDPAASGLVIKRNVDGAYAKLKNTLLKNPDTYGYFGASTSASNSDN